MNPRLSSVLFLYRNSQKLFQHRVLKLCSISVRSAQRHTTILNKQSIFKRLMATGQTNDPPSKLNRLSKEKSSYLQQHASNPVDWYPWGLEAFEKAKQEDKLIFLSVGYSTCHWCHVMERESFENEDVARIMNDSFISVKVDREERPDVDKVYMLFVQAISGGGGWPMSVWLTPDLKPIAGGTYFPPDDRYYGRPGFSSILLSLAAQWEKNKQKVLDQGTIILDTLMSATSIRSSAEHGNVVAEELLDKGLKQLTRGFEPEFGGFSEAPKFPQPVILDFLFLCYHNDSKSLAGQKALEMATMTLEKMARGGIHDHINKGFHRYSTDKEWHVPHFEKMLYDQAQLAVSYLTAYQMKQQELFETVCHDILDYVNRDLGDESGGFYSAEDADSLPNSESSSKKEGAFCVWAKKEVDEHLSESVSADHQDLKLSTVFSAYFNVNESGNVDPYKDPHHELKTKNVLMVRRSMEDTAAELQIDLSVLKSSLERAKKILFDIRKERPKPHLDTKILTSWNGLMISAFAKAGQVFKNRGYMDRAIKAADFVRTELFDATTHSLLRSTYAENGGLIQILDPIPGFIDDYAFTIQGLIDLYELTFDPQWLVWAEELQDKQDGLFWDISSYGYFTSRDEDKSIVLRLKEDQDGAEPSGNSVSLSNLVKLASYLNRPDFKSKADDLIKLFSERLGKIPVSLPKMMYGVLLAQAAPRQVIIIGDKNNNETQEMIKVVHSHFCPDRIVIFIDPCDSENVLVDRLDVLKSMLSSRSSNVSTAYVCENFMCSLPVNCAKELAELMR